MGCVHLVFPNPITGVATTDATLADSLITSVTRDRPAGEDLMRGRRHYLNSGYLSVALR
jgi:hypothetical protein